MDEVERSSIRKIIAFIREAQVDNKEEYFATKYATFKKKYPNLYSVACNDKVDLANLDFMLHMLEKMKKDNVSQYDASAEVGQLLYSQFVEPKFKN
jgi:hypothetical protein